MSLFNVAYDDSEFQSLRLFASTAVSMYILKKSNGKNETVAQTLHKQTFGRDVTTDDLLRSVLDTQYLHHSEEFKLATFHLCNELDNADADLKAIALKMKSNASLAMQDLGSFVVAYLRKYEVNE